MKKIIVLLSLLAITNTLHTMELANPETHTVIPLRSTVDHEKITINMPVCPSLISECKQLQYSEWPNKEKLKIIAQGIGAGAGLFGILETFAALLGAKGLASDPTFLVMNGCTSLAFCLIYISVLGEWHCHC